MSMRDPLRPFEKINQFIGKSYLKFKENPEGSKGREFTDGQFFSPSWRESRMIIAFIIVLARLWHDSSICSNSFFPNEQHRQWHAIPGIHVSWEWFWHSGQLSMVSIRGLFVIWYGGREHAPWKGYGASPPLQGVGPAMGNQHRSIHNQLAGRVQESIAPLNFWGRIDTNWEYRSDNGYYEHIYYVNWHTILPVILAG